MSPKKSKAFDAWVSQNSTMSNVIDDIVFRLQMKSQPPMPTAELKLFLLREFATIAWMLDKDYREFCVEYSRDENEGQVDG